MNERKRAAQFSCLLVKYVTLEKLSARVSEQNCLPLSSAMKLGQCSYIWNALYRQDDILVDRYRKKKRLFNFVFINCNSVDDLWGMRITKVKNFVCMYLPFTHVHVIVSPALKRPLFFLFFPFFSQWVGCFFCCGVGFRGHFLWQDGFVEVLVTCSSSPLTGFVFFSYFDSLFYFRIDLYFYIFMYRFVFLYFYVSICISILLCQCKV